MASTSLNITARLSKLQRDDNVVTFTIACTIGGKTTDVQGKLRIDGMDDESSSVLDFTLKAIMKGEGG